MTSRSKNKMDYEIETANGLYKIKKPTGRLGMLNFTILTKIMPKSSETDKEGNVIMSPRDEERFENGLMEWSEKVLKHIIVAKDSIFGYEDMPGEDQFAIFMAISQKANINQDELFRFV